MSARGPACFVLISASLAFGTLAAVTAYLPPLDAVAASVEAGGVLTLNADAGRGPETGPDGRIRPIAATGGQLTPEVVQRLRAAGVQRVRVREFSFARWTHRWMFAASVLGLLAGGLVLRQGRAATAGKDAAARMNGQAPADMLAAARAGLASLKAELPALQSENGCRRIVQVLGDLQSGPLDSFANARELLIDRHGMACSAAIMSRFAVMERQVNRAWSVVVDGVFDEAAECVHRACELVPAVEAALRQES